MTATSKRPEVKEPGNRQGTMRDPMDHIRKVPIVGANRNDKNSLQGNIAELGNNIYQYGTRDQGDRFTRTTEAIADYIGRV
jgi:hypothetical protein